MAPTFRFTLIASSLLAVAAPAALCAAGPAVAQAGGEQAPQQVALTQKQIDGVIASQSEMSAAQAKLPPGNADKPDAKLQSKMEAIAKKNGFTGLEQFEAAAESIGMVMAGIDPETKSYVGPATVIQKQIAQVQSDKSLPPKDKAQALKELKEALSTSDSVKPQAGNIELVSKNFDRLSQAFQSAGGE